MTFADCASGSCFDSRCRLTLTGPFAESRAIRNGPPRKIGIFLPPINTKPSGAKFWTNLFRKSNPAIREFMEAEGTETEFAPDVIDLVKTFQQVLERVRSRPIIQVDEETVSVSQMVGYLRRRLSLEDRPIRLKQMLSTVQSRQALVCLFLAMLELVRLQAIQLRQDKLFGEILVRKHEQFDEVMKEQAAVRDDWK